MESIFYAWCILMAQLQPQGQLSLLKILPPKKADLNPIEIQLKSTVKASEIAHHKPQDSTVNIGRIRSNQVTNPSTISQWVRWSMGSMVYSNVGCLTAIGTTPCKS
jgi:hypothetical protein